MIRLHAKFINIQLFSLYLSPAFFLHSILACFSSFQCYPQRVCAVSECQTKNKLREKQTQKVTNNNAISLSSNLCDAADVIAAAAAHILHVPFYTTAAKIQRKAKDKRNKTQRHRIRIVFYVDNSRRRRHLFAYFCVCVHKCLSVSVIKRLKERQ